ncbi:molybdopterin-binding protein [Loktanella sp. DJP18]|uniref:molybdopterin-binding protein n=1 Tax=Loktanella sp. DJP18 TaxID=3409788 RepID=UPI003BB56013
MRFGPVPLADALGGILAHREVVADGTLPKGHILTAPDIDSLAAVGLAEVTIARLDPPDVDEDAAAASLARALIGIVPGLRLSVAATGRVNVIADGPGLAALDVAALHAVNRVDPMITVATVPDLHRMDAGGLVATIKIIAYAVPRAHLDAACVAGARAIALHRPVIDGVALIETRIGRDLGDKGMRSLQTRLDRLGVGFAGRIMVSHDSQAIAEALKTSDAPLVCILTGSATSDLHDTAPEGLRQAGGTVAHFGMPVDPGNLLFLGDLDGRPVIGLPGCARSPALNGADWVLERLLCGVAVTPDDICAMGVGGLLKEIPTRPRPRRQDD